MQDGTVLLTLPDRKLCLLYYQLCQVEHRKTALKRECPVLKLRDWIGLHMTMTGFYCEVAETQAKSIFVRL